MRDWLSYHGSLHGTVEVQQDSDAEAIQHAHRINIPSGGGRFEVWQGNRPVHTHYNP